MSCSTELTLCVSQLGIQTRKLETKHLNDTKLQKQPAYSEGKMPIKHSNIYDTLDKLCVTSQNRIGIFIWTILNILTDNMLGLMQLLTDLTEAWKVKCITSYILFMCIRQVSLRKRWFLCQLLWSIMMSCVWTSCIIMSCIQNLREFSVPVK